MIYTVRHTGQDVPARVTAVNGALGIEMGDRRYAVEVTPRLGRTHYRITIDGTAYAVAVTRSAGSMLVVLGPDRYEFAVLRGRPARPAASMETSGPARRDVHAPMPGLVVSTMVQPGDTVVPGRVVAVMEAMKMQMEIRAPAAGRVLAVPAQAGVEVPRGTVLVTLETTGPGDSGLGD